MDVRGPKVAELLSMHTLDRCLRGDSSRWAALEAVVAAIPSTADWQRVLTAYGYELQRRRDGGFLVRYRGAPIAVAHPKGDPMDFGRLDAEGRPPEGLLINDARADGAPYGLLASGSRLRLFDAGSTHGPATARYLELDAAALKEHDRPFLGLLGPAYLARGGLRRLQDEARAFGADLWRRLDDRVRQSVLPTLGRALGRWAAAQGQDLGDDVVREELRRGALTVVFRTLFLLYAESARHLPGDLSALVQEATDTATCPDPRSTLLWDGFVGLVRAMRTGDGFEGAAILERAELADPDFGRVLIGLGHDPETGTGVDYSTLEIGHLGHIYEGLLSLQLSIADTALRYDAKADRYVAPSEGERPDVEAGDLLWLTHRGGRKTAGAYYTRAELVRHLVRHTVVPAFGRHLDVVRGEARHDPSAAARALLEFAVLDPACGSAHFLVHVANEFADLVVSFLAQTPLPQVRDTLSRLAAGASPGAMVEDVALIRRLVLKRCVYGVDLSPMGAEIAKLSLWLAAFVPGLPLAYLDRNIQVGNSLVGVADPATMRPPGHDPLQRLTFQDRLDEAIAMAAEAAVRVAESDDRSRAETRAATAGVQRLLSLWTAEPFGLTGARREVELRGAEVVGGATNGLTTDARRLAEEHRFFHWPLAFPQVFHRPNPGFDAVVGNPPWEEVTVEARSFYALHRPGIRRGLSEVAR
ncbi:MAG: Eco57I restriction-modification methylase domain-containing protein, partial [Egibacteraceae bacterium]